MIKLTTYYGHDIWIDPARVLYVSDRGAGSRGVSANIRLDTNETVNVSGWAETIARQVEEAKLPALQFGALGAPRPRRSSQ